MALSTAYQQHPEHRIEIDDERVGLRVSHNGVVLAETTRGLNLREGNYPPIVYVPREDVDLEKLVPSELSTHCPFKGDASYFRAVNPGSEDSASEEIAWSYETPFDQMDEIRGHIAFYSDRVTVERV